MRRLLPRVATALSLATLLSLATALLSAAGPDLLGTALVNAIPEPNAVVWLVSRDTPSGQPRKYVLDQRNLNFHPHVLTVPVGAMVEFPNSDRVFHNVFSFKNAKRFDLGMYPIGTARRVRFDQEGLSRIFCNIHPNMAAYVMVVDSPYFAVSDERGQFVIPSVTPGTYTYHAWRPGGTTITGTTTVEAGKPLEIRWP